MSSVVSGLFAMFLVMWGVIAGVNMVQLMSVHNTLAFVARQAARSESVSGCWTPTTNAVVLQTLQNQGFPTARVRVSAYSAAPGNPYGAPIIVGLQVTDQLELLGAKTPITLTVSATDTATSQWVPTAGVTSNAACSTPSGLMVMNGAAQSTSGGGPYNGE